MKQIARVVIGSQNYHLDGPQSDIDQKLIVLPDFDTLFAAKDAKIPVNDSEHEVVMDFRNFHKQIKKCNINALELLFTPLVYEQTWEWREYAICARNLLNNGYLRYRWNDFRNSVAGNCHHMLTKYPERKHVSRAEYYNLLMRELVLNGWNMDYNTWHSPHVWEYPRQIRYENADFHSLEDMQRHIARWETVFFKPFSEPDGQAMEAELDKAAKRIVYTYLMEECNVLEEETQR